jgi:WD40 repeat protein
VDLWEKHVMTNSFRVMILVACVVWCGCDRRARAVDAPAKVATAVLLDRYGDPLPAQAVARLGTVRYRAETAGWPMDLRFDQRSSVISAGVESWNVHTGKRTGMLPLPKNDPDVVLRGVSADGELMVVSELGEKRENGGMPRVLVLRDARTGKVLRRLEEAELEGRAGEVVFSRDGRYVAVLLTAWTHGVAVGFAVWDVRTGKRLFTQKNPALSDQALGSGLDFSPDGSRLVFAGGDEALRTYAMPGGEAKESFKSDIRLQAVRFVDGATVCAAAGEGMALWKIGEPTAALWKRPSSYVHQLAVSPDGRLVAAAGQALTVTELPSGNVVPLAGVTGGQVAAVAFSPDGRMLAFSRGQAIEFLEVGTWKVLFAMEAHSVSIQGTAVSEDGEKIATVDEQGFARLWESNGKPLLAFRQGQTGAYEMAFSPDGKTLATAHGLWDVGSGTLRAGFDGDAVCLVRFIDQGRRVLEVGAKAVRWRDASSGRVVQELATEPRSDIVRATLSADGATLAWSEANERYLYKGDPISPSAPPVFTAHVYDLRLGKEIARFRAGAHALSLSPDGKRLAVGEDVDYTERPAQTHVSIRNSATGEVQHRFAIIAGYPSLLEWSPDGRYLAADFRDNRIRLYRTDSFQEVAVLTGHTHYIQRLCWFPDSSRLVSAGYDTTGLIWDIRALDRQPTHLP